MSRHQVVILPPVGWPGTQPRLDEDRAYPRVQRRQQDHPLRHRLTRAATADAGR